MARSPTRPQPWQVIPEWRLEQKWQKGNAIYVHPDLNLRRPLYRYMHFEKAVRMLADREMWFSAPDQWEDPHEAWWCKHLFRDRSHLATAYAYGTCWTRKWLDEPFWRIYGCRCDDGKPKKKSKAPAVLPAVRFRASGQALFQWLRQSVEGQAAKAYMGRVRYCPYDQLEHEARRVRATSNGASPIAATGLHLKRQAFRFEDEVRMLWIDRGGRRAGHALAFDPTLLFDQVMIGPVRDEHLDRYSYVEARLIDLGIPPSKIVPSRLFNPPHIPT